MKNHHKLFVATLLSAAIGSNANAADVNVYGKVIAPIAVDVAGMVNFGLISAGSSSSIGLISGLCALQAQATESTPTVANKGGAYVTVKTYAPATITFDKSGVKVMDADNVEVTNPGLSMTMTVYEDNESDECVSLASSTDSSSVVTKTTSNTTEQSLGFFIGGTATANADLANGTVAASGDYFSGSISVTANYN
ncbi:MAG: hypothetical protein HWE20_14920 [Gammaproteobacteria bacterium]|nr:hypothetical protein [Gammaproteobacteria bacterium]